MPWIVSGSCVHCGLCCKPPVVVENPCIELGQDRCLFYTDDVDTSIRYGHCLIKQVGDNYNRVRDRFGNRMTDDQIRWYEANCRQYPKLIDHLAKEHGGYGVELPPGCGYTIEEVP